jgi:hypothetical protein
MLFAIDTILFIINNGFKLVTRAIAIAVVAWNHFKFSQSI